MNKQMRDISGATYHCVQFDKSMPVNALHVRIAVRIKTVGSLCGFSPVNVTEKKVNICLMFQLSPENQKY